MTLSREVVMVSCRLTSRFDFLFGLGLTLLLFSLPVTAHSDRTAPPGPTACPGTSCICIANSLSAADTTFLRPNPSLPFTCPGNAPVVRYDAYGFNLTGCTTFPTSVTVTLCSANVGCPGVSGQNLDTILYIYRKSDGSASTMGSPIFDTAAPCNANAVTLNDDVAGCSAGSVLSGLSTPLNAGHFVAVVTAFSAGLQMTGNYNLFVDAAGAGCTVVREAANCPAITLSPAGPALPDGTEGTAYNQMITQTGGATPVGFTVTSGTLPSPVMLSMAGALSGTPAAPGNSSFTVTMTDANLCTSSSAYTLKVLPRTPVPSSNSPICSGQDLNLSTPMVYGGATYAWTGPNAFTSSAQYPSIVGATAMAAGTYNVMVTVNSVTSLAGSTMVAVNADGVAPVVTAPGALTSIQTLCQ